MSNRSARRPASRLLIRKFDFLFVVVTLIVAVLSGVEAYRAVGPYADGPINVGLFRTTDSLTGRALIYRTVRRPDGTSAYYAFDDVTRGLREVRLTRSGQAEQVTLRVSGDGNKELQLGGQSIAVEAKSGSFTRGFSLRGNGIIDAWEYRDRQGGLQRIDISRLQDGKVDRWEYYRGDELLRVELDDDRNGRVDRWIVYEDGILIRESRDKDGDGQADPF